MACYSSFKGKRVSIVLVLALLGAGALAAGAKANEAGKRPTPLETRIFTGRSGRHTFLVRLVKGPFRRSQHRVRVSGSRVWIDGKPEWNKDGSKNWYGTDGGLPTTEFYAFEATVDGRRWPIPRRLYGNCYEPNIRRVGVSECVEVQLSPDGNRLTIMLAGSDGDGSYSVHWDLRRNGKHTRKIAYGDE